MVCSRHSTPWDDQTNQGVRESRCRRPRGLPEDPDVRDHIRSNHVKVREEVAKCDSGVVKSIDICDKMDTAVKAVNKKMELL